MSEVSEGKEEINSALSEQVSGLESLAELTGMRVDTHPDFKDLKAKVAETPKNNGNAPKTNNKPVEADPLDEETEEEDEGEEVSQTESKPKKEQGDKKPEKKEVQQKSTEKKKSAEPEEDEGEEDDEDEQEEVDDPNDIFGIKRKGSSKNEKAALEIGEQAQSYIEKKYSIKDSRKFFETVDTWRNSAQKLKEKETELEDLREGLEALPPQLATAIQLFASGDEWQNAFTTNRIDFNKSFDKQDQETIVSYYFADKFKSLKNKYQKAELDEDSYKERIGDLFDSSKRLYDADKQSIETQRATLIQRNNDAKTALKESAVSSVEKLKDNWPDFKPAQLQRIKQILVNGDIEGLFRDKNGRYKESAAETLAFAEYGKQMFMLLTDRAEKKGKNAATEEIVHLGNKKRPVKKNNDANDNSKVEKAVEHLSFASQEKDPYAHVPGK